MNNTINSFVLIGILFIFVFWSIFVNLVSSQNKMSSIGSVQVLDKHCWELVYINSTGTVQVWHKHFGGGVDFWVHYVYSMWHLVGIFFIFCPWSIYYLFVHIVVPPYIIGLTLLAKGGTGTMSLRKKKQSFNIFPSQFKNFLLHIRSNYQHPKRLRFCSTVVKTPTHLVFDIKMNLHTTPPPPSHPTTAETPITQYLSGY